MQSPPNTLLVPGRLPNLRDLIIPDTQASLIDMDLARADLQVVARESNCARLIAIFEEERRDPTKDVHTANARDLFGNDKGHLKHYRDLSKKIAHAADYLVTARTGAQQTGLSVTEMQRFLDRWYWLHPEIPQWHKDTAHRLQLTREIRNPFGFRRYFFGRIEDSLPEAVAWVPQSTVGLIINKALMNIYNHPKLKGVVKLLLQVHDSLVTQVPTERLEELVPIIEQCSLIEVPYDPPLVIPVGFKVSNVSWGQVKDYKGPRYVPQGISKLAESVS